MTQNDAMPDFGTEEYSGRILCLPESLLYDDLQKTPLYAKHLCTRQGVKCSKVCGRHWHGVDNDKFFLFHQILHLSEVPKENKVEPTQ